MNRIKQIAAGVLAASLFLARLGHAMPGWVQLPGLATQIAVGANDIPYVLDINGYVQYLAPSTLACSGSLCVQTERDWVFTNIRASHIASDQYGYLWSIDSGGALSVVEPSTHAFDTSLLFTGLTACISSLAPGRRGPIPERDYPFGVAARDFQLHYKDILIEFFTTTYFTRCGSPSLSTVDLSFSEEMLTTSERWFSLLGPQTIDTGELQVTNFTVDGSATQIPWILAPLSNGVVTAWAHTAPNTYVAAPPPTVLGLQIPITYATDHYVVAANHVWMWGGDAYGKRGKPVWVSVPNSWPPTGSTIVQIAYSGALQGTSIGTIGPSNMYMIDSNDNIYQWGDVGPVK